MKEFFKLWDRFSVNLWSYRSCTQLILKLCAESLLVSKGSKKKGVSANIKTASRLPFALLQKNIYSDFLPERPAFVREAVWDVKG